MKALVLAGGTGVRLRPVSHTLPKQLVPVANKPVLFYGLEGLAEAGITEVGIVVGEHQEEIPTVVGDGSRFGLRVTYLPQERPLGLAHCVLIARDFLGADDFLMYLGDNVVPGGIDALVRQVRVRRAAATLLVGSVPDPTECGVAEVDDTGRVLSLEEKSPTPRSDLAMIGVYAFTPAIHEAVRSIEPSWRSELEITQAIQWLVERGDEVRAHVFTGYWRDTGRLSSLLDCNREMLLRLEPGIRGKVDGETDIAGPVLLEEGAHLLRSRVVGPVVIGANTVVTDSYVGPFTSIGPDCVLDEVDIHYSVVLAGSMLSSVRYLRHSLLGRGAYVRSDEVPAGAWQLVLGDDSRVLIGE
jgi:glucose-1-phosphate thymidylyltransferase